MICPLAVKLPVWDSRQARVATAGTPHCTIRNLHNFLVLKDMTVEDWHLYCTPSSPWCPMLPTSSGYPADTSSLQVPCTAPSHHTDTATVPQSVNALRAYFDFLLIIGVSTFFLELQTKSGEMFSLFIECFCSHRLDRKITWRTGFHSFSCFDSVKEMLSVSNGILNQPSPCTHFKIPWS